MRRLPISRATRNRLYLFCGTAAMIAVVIVIAILELLYLRHEAENRVTATTANLAKSLTLTFDGVVDTIDIALFDSVDEYHTEMASGKLVGQDFIEFLTRQQKHLPVTPYIRATDAHGDIIYGKDLHPPFTNVADRDYFLRQRDDPNLGLFVGKPIFSRVNQRWIWPFSRRLNKPDGTFAGVVYAALYVGQINEILAQIRLDKGETISVRHAGLELIAGRDEATAIYPIKTGDDGVSRPFLESLKTNPAAGSYISNTTKLDNVSRIFSYRRSKKYDFLVNVGTTGESVYAEWRKQAWITGIFLLSFILTTLGFATLIMRSWFVQERDLSALNEAHELANLGNFKIDLKSGQINASRSVYRILGITRKYVVNLESWLELIKVTSHDDTPMKLDYIIEHQLAADREYQIVRANDQQERWVHSKGKLQFDANGKPAAFVGTIQDITERKLAEDEIRNLAYFDLLTGLPNRRLLYDRLTHALVSGDRAGKKGALFILDLDNFKTLNDTSGHHVGDLLLTEVAARLAGCVRASDTVARLGGDEFVVMLEGLSNNFSDAMRHAEIVGTKILKVLNQPYQLPGCAHHSTPSIGITLFSGNQQSADELMKRADTAMYQAKEGGRNTLRFFDPDMQRAIEAQVQVESDLRNAITQHQFQLHYQAQVDADGSVIGAEALIRWRHPERGMVSPAQFIPVAEKSGLILPIGHWVLEAACVQLSAWANAAETAHLTLAVNVSARQFGIADFVEDVLAVLDRTGARADKLKLELTEGLLVENAEDVIAKMTALKARGVAFSLDDFGTGYSSLSYLKRLPLDQLKIDQSFVREVLTDANDAAIARTVVALGHSLGLAVIAEGVETAEQRDFLASVGCFVYQGYFFSKPLAVADFEVFIRNQKLHEIQRL